MSFWGYCPGCYCRVNIESNGRYNCCEYGHVLDPLDVSRGVLWTRPSGDFPVPDRGEGWNNKVGGLTIQGSEA